MRKGIFPLLCCIFCLGMVSCGPAREEQDQQPNIVFIMADDLGIGDIGKYGQQIIKTPNIDRLAKEGMTFNNFYAGSTVCAPSRATLMTGQHTGRTKIRGNGEFPLDPEKKIIPELLKENGYTTAMFGKWGLGLEGTTGSPEKRGWDYFKGHLHHVDGHFQRPDSLDAIVNGELKEIETPEKSFANDLFTQGAIEFIKEQNAEDPFFLYLSFTVPHAELVVPDRYLQAHLGVDGKSVHRPEKPQPEGRHYGAQKFPKAAYAALVESVDDYVGMVMQTLKEKGVGENTMIIFTSDNGTHIEGGRTMEDVTYFNSSGMYRGIKRDLYSGGIKEPFIVRWPSKVPAGAVSNHTAAFWDVYPTFSEMMGTPGRQDLVDGISFLPSLTGSGSQKKHDYLYWEFHESGGKQALLKGDWKAIRLGVRENRNAPIELYNLAEDPGEQVNLAEQYPEKAAALALLMDSVRTPNEHFDF